jgi:ferredoxin-NADP reductase
MPLYTLKLLSRQQITKDLIEFVFEKPAAFHYQAGQYGGFTLLSLLANNPTEATRRFTFLSTPDEPVLRITTRIQTSPYKQALLSLDIGDQIKLAGPSGQFICHDDVTIPAVMIAGGIGVTPFYSIIKNKTLEKSKQSLFLFYGNESQISSAYLDELNSLEANNPYFKFIPTLTNANEFWTGERGYITHTMIKKYVPDLLTAIYYICGSPNMVTALQETLLELDIPSIQIKTEDFPGY